MSLATATFTTNNYPSGVDNKGNSIQFNGQVSIGAGQYPATGVPITAWSNPTGYEKTPFKARMDSIANGFEYLWDQNSNAIRIYEATQAILKGGFPPALAAAGTDFTIHANWGTGATAAVTGYQNAFTCTVTSVSSGSGANPTLVLTFPTAMPNAPIYVVDRGDDAAESAYFVFTSSTTTTATFTFIGTPASAHVYVLNARGAAVNVPVTAIFGGNYVFTSVASTTGVYTGTITNGDNNAYVGQTVTITGFTNAANNGTFTVTASNSTTLTTTNTASVSETHAGLAVSSTVTLGSGWGATASAILATNSVQGSFFMTITAQATTAANPTVTITFPSPYESAPNFICSRADSLSDAGYFVFTSSTTTQVVFTFVGTPTATHVYKFSAMRVGYKSTTLVTAAAFAATNFGTGSAIAVLAGTQNSFEISVTAGTSPSANPTIALTFPVPYISTPQFVCCRADILSDAGYWAIKTATATVLTLEFVGTPTAAHVYKVSAGAWVYNGGYTELTPGQNIPEGVVDDFVTGEIYCVRG